MSECSLLTHIILSVLCGTQGNNDPCHISLFLCDMECLTLFQLTEFGEDSSVPGVFWPTRPREISCTREQVTALTIFDS